MNYDFSKLPGQSKKSISGLNIDPDNPLVSIITPFYNLGEIFWQTYNSVINQTFPWFEWIIVDDGSTAETSLKILRELEKGEDPRTVVLHKANGGIASARNMAIEHSRTQYILPLDADDLIAPTFVEYTWWMLEHDKKAAWAYTDSLGFEGEEYLWSHRFDPIRMKTYNHITCTALIRKEWILRAGGYAEISKHYNEDWRLWLKILALGGYPVQSMYVYSFCYRKNSTGVMTKVKVDKKIKAENERIISQAADEVVNPQSPTIYPTYSNFHPYQALQKSDFGRKKYAKNDKIQILMIIPWMVMGGADLFNLDFVKGLDTTKYALTIVTTVPSDNPWMQKFQEYVDDIFCMPNFMSMNSYPEFIDYIINTRNISQIFLSNSYLGYYMLPWLKANHPQISVVDYVHMEEMYWREGGYARISGNMDALIDKTYVCNSATEQLMIDRWNKEPDRIQTVHIGIDSKKFDPAGIEAGQVYAELGIDEERPIVLFICRIHPQKRPFLMLRIAEQVQEIIPNVAFVVVGDGSQYELLKGQIRVMKLGNTVYCVGPKDDPRPYYKDAKLTLVCSIKEGLSLTAYESCSMATPVVSADVGGQKDLIDDKVGRLIPLRQDENKDFNDREFPEEEIRDYVQAIIEILEDDKLYGALCKNARERVIAAFKISDMTAFFDQELEAVMQNETLTMRRIQNAEASQRLAGSAEEAYLTGCVIESYAGNPYDNIPVPGGPVSKLKRLCKIILPEGTWLRTKLIEIYLKYRKQQNK